MNCPKCNSNVTKDDTFCPKCGNQIKHEKHILEIEQKQYKETGKSSMYKWLWFTIGIIVLGLIFVSVVPLPYTAKEVYTEKVPYNEPYSVQNCEKRLPKYDTKETAGYTIEGKLNEGFIFSNFENQEVHSSG